MNDKLKLFGKQIAKIRSRKQLTQEQLAELIGYSTNHISKLESARTNPSFDLIMNIADALKVDVKELFDFENKNIIENYIKIILEKLRENPDKTEMFYKIVVAITE